MYQLRQTSLAARARARRRRPKSFRLKLGVGLLVVAGSWFGLSYDRLQIYPAQTVLDFGDFRLEVGQIEANLEIDDIPVDSSYPELVCNRPDYLASHFTYPDWLNQADSAEFKAHAQAYALTQLNQPSLAPGIVSNRFYCLDYYQQAENDPVGRQAFAASLSLAQAYLKQNNRLTVSYQITAQIDQLELGQIKLQLVSGRENLATKQVGDNSHWAVVRQPRSGQYLDTRTKLADQATKAGRAWADVINQSKISDFQLRVSYRNQVKLIRL